MNICAFKRKRMMCMTVIKFKNNKKKTTTTNLTI